MAVTPVTSDCPVISVGMGGHLRLGQGVLGLASGFPRFIDVPRRQQKPVLHLFPGAAEQRLRTYLRCGQIYTAYRPHGIQQTLAPEPYVPVRRDINGLVVLGVLAHAHGRAALGQMYRHRRRGDGVFHRPHGPQRIHRRQLQLIGCGFQHPLNDLLLPVFQSGIAAVAAAYRPQPVSHRHGVVPAYR